MGYTLHGSYAEEQKKGMINVDLDLIELQDRILYREDEFKIYLNELLEQNLIEDERAEGIARLVLDKGIEQLSRKQKQVFFNHGVGYVNYASACERCADEIPWVEMLGAVWIFEDNLCSYCRHKKNKGE